MFMQSAVTWCFSPLASLCRVWLILLRVSQTSNGEIIYVAFGFFFKSLWVCKSKLFQPAYGP